MVTGSGRGIGRAAALLFTREGGRLVLVARTLEQLEETAALCREIAAACDPLIMPADLSDHRQIGRVFADLTNRGIRIDVLVNNAASFVSGPVSQFSLEEFQYLLAVNLHAPFLLSQRVIPMMIERGGGAIINVSSLSGCFGTAKFPGFGAYNISKYGLWGLTEILALENRQHNIRVNQISLSGVDTQMFREAAPPGVKADLTPEQVAREILYLVSEESAPITGNNLILDGRSRRWQSDD